MRLMKTRIKLASAAFVLIEALGGSLLWFGNFGRGDGAAALMGVTHLIAALVVTFAITTYEEPKA